jgi:amidase
MNRRHLLRSLAAGAAAPLGLSIDRAFAQAPATPPGTETALHFLSLQDVGRRIASREMSSLRLTQSMLERISAVDPSLKSYATVMRDRALADARAADEEMQRGRYRGPLHGVPIAVKDLCYTTGVPTMGGTAALKTFVPHEDGTVVAKLRAAGAVLLGKLNLTEGAMIGYNPTFGVPLNPWNRNRWPGGSSSGSGVATAAGLCFAAIGTDTGGSIRFPSSACGIVGLKPTYGRVSRFGVLALAESLDHVGPMARRVADVAIVFDAIAGHDPKDSTSLRDPVTSVVGELSKGVDGVRIGIDRDYALKGIDRGQAAALEEALKVLETRGARIVDVKMPALDGMIAAWSAITGSEARKAHATTFPRQADDYGPYFRTFMESSASISEKQLADARAWRDAFANRMHALLDSVDVMACPAGGDPAWPITHELQIGPLPAFHAAWAAASPRAAEFTMPMDLAGTPAICLPSGFSTDGLPYSIQFAGRRLGEGMLCRIASAYEQATNWHLRHPPVD